MPLNKISVTVILKEKPSAVFTVPKEASVADAVIGMNQHRIGSIMVVDQGRAVGIFTERDVLTRVVSANIDPRNVRVRDVMTAKFSSITAATSVEDAMQIMTDKRVRHLPVMEGNTVIGMISIGDVTRWLLKANELEAENLRKYVFAEYPG